MNLAQRWGFRDVEKKCKRFARELGLTISVPTGKKAMRLRQARRKAHKKATKRKQKLRDEHKLEESSSGMSARKVKRPRPVVAKVFNAGQATRKTRAEYDFAMQDTVDAEYDKLQNCLERKERVRKGKKRGRVTDADGYFSLPVDLMRLLDLENDL